MEPQSKSENCIPAKAATLDILSISVLFCASIIVTNPLGDFPLDDDWSFGLAVKHMIESGDFRPTGWTSMPLIVQVFWGRLFAFFGGFSFSTLRVSTLTLSLCGIVAMYLLMRELRQPRWLAGMASLMLAFSPIYYALSHTFMTDVPYTAIAIMASVAFVQNLKTGSRQVFFLGIILAAAATLTRQLGLSIPLAFAAAYIFRNGVTCRNIVLAITPLLLCAGSLVVFQWWLAATGRLPALYGTRNEAFFHSITRLGTIPVLAYHTYSVALYLGLLLLPVLLIVIDRMFGSHRKVAIVLLTLTAITMALATEAKFVFTEKELVSTFSATDIVDLPRLVERLRRQSDGVSAFLWQRLPPPSQGTIGSYQPSDSATNQVQRLVVQALNDMVDDKCIFTNGRFQEVLLRPETRSLMNQNPAGRNLARLNRLLLEDAYPFELSRVKETRLLMPCIENIVIDSGIGPLSLHDTESLFINRRRPFPHWFWLTVTVISLLGATLLITTMGFCAKQLFPKLLIHRLDGTEAAGAFLLLCAVIYLIPLLVTGLYDRYLVPAIPFLAAGMAGVLLPAPRRAAVICRFSAVTVVCAFGLFAVGCTRDYMTWNRLRWASLSDLMNNDHVKAQDIDGGFEFNGWYFYDPNYKIDPKKSRWWVQGDTYRIGFGEMPGYAIVKEQTYHNWLPPYVGKIVVVKEIAR